MPEIPWSLTDLAASHAKGLGQYDVLPKDVRESLAVGDMALLIFRRKSDDKTERIWLTVLQVQPTASGIVYQGETYNTSAVIPQLYPKKKVLFEPKHVLEIHRAPIPKPRAPTADPSAPPSEASAPEPKNNEPVE